MKRKEKIFFLIFLVIFPALVGINSQGQWSERVNGIASNSFPLTMNFSTFLGGSSGEYGYSIVVAPDGSSYMTGETTSDDFPTMNAYNSTYGGNADAFVAKFSVGGSLLWSTYLGGNDSDVGVDIAIDNDNNCYVTGDTTSVNFPTKNAYDNSYNGGYSDAFVTKFTPNGSLLWSTFLGGEDEDYGGSIAIAIDSNCYVIGFTGSSNFPTLNTYNSTYGGIWDAFITKFAANGSLLWSTYLGGNKRDVDGSITTAGDASCYVIGYTYSTNFPTLYAFDNTSNGSYDIFVSKFSASGTLVWSTYFGGSDSEFGLSIAVTSDDSCYITGLTDSLDFPTMNAYDNTCGGGYDAFVAKFSTNGSLLWSTYLGGSDIDVGVSISVDNDGSCYVTGSTYSSNFPSKHAYNNTFGGGVDAFITKFTANGLLYWSTYFGGSDNENGNSISLGSDGSCYVTGETESSNFPILNAYDDSLNGDSDVFIAKFLELEDVLKPMITAIEHIPASPTYKDNITIFCLVTDNIGIQSVTLYYNTNNTSWISKEMLRGSGDNYSTQIGPFNPRDVVKYYVEAEDYSPNHNIAINNNNGEFYEINIPPITNRRAAYILLGVIAITIPIIIVLAIRKRGK